MGEAQNHSENRPTEEAHHSGAHHRSHQSGRGSCPCYQGCPCSCRGAAGSIHRPGCRRTRCQAAACAVCPGGSEGGCAAEAGAFDPESPKDCGGSTGSIYRQGGGRACGEAAAGSVGPESPKDCGGAAGAIHRQGCGCACCEAETSPISPEGAEDRGGAAGSVHREGCGCASREAETSSISPEGAENR